MILTPLKQFEPPFSKGVPAELVAARDNIENDH